MPVFTQRDKSRKKRRLALPVRGVSTSALKRALRRERDRQLKFPPISRKEEILRVEPYANQGVRFVVTLDKTKIKYLHREGGKR